MGNNVYINDMEINHQFDKSSIFLSKASDYIRKYIDNQVVVQSPISSMWELQIARVFCEEPKLQCFHSLFLSCNEPKLDVCSYGGGFDWCLRCDKCSFIFLLLSAWMAPAAVIDVFHGRSLFLDRAHEGSFMKLIGMEGVKPFDCVGTVEEASAAIHLSLLRFIYDELDKSGEGAIDIDAKKVDRCIISPILDSNNGDVDEDGARVQHSEGSIHRIPLFVSLPVVLSNLSITLGLLIEIKIKSSIVEQHSGTCKACYRYFDSSLLCPDDVLRYWKLS